MIRNFTLVFILLLSSYCIAQSVNIEGDPYGGNPYLTINDAIAASTNSADVILITGTHTETVVVDKSITLRGSSPATDIIQTAASSGTGGGGTRPLFLGEGNFNITIENLGIRYGNIDNSVAGNGNGGGIVIEKVTGLATLSNLIVEDNFTTRNGGGIGIAGSNVNIVGCTIRNNTSSLDGGAIIAAPNNGAAIDCTVNIEQTLIDSNTGRNGGGIYLNGNNGFGNDFLLDCNIINSTVNNNNATSASGGNGGGSIFSAGQPYTVNTSVANITLKLVHSTFYGNTHASLNKSGIQFGSNAATNFSAYNSIVVSTLDDVATKSINFANANTTDVINCILGGLNAAPLTIIDDAAKNNLKGRTGTQAGISTGVLSDEGGNTLVLPINEISSADDFCTAATGQSLPSIDQRGYTREGTPDAGAYEFGATLSITEKPIESSVKIFPNPVHDVVHIEGIDNIEVLRFYSILGTLNKVVYSQSWADVSDLSDGMYLVLIETSDNKQITRRLVIH